MDTKDIKTLFNEKNTFAAATGIHVQAIAPGKALCFMAIRDEHRNLFGTVNAGAIYALAETAFGAAANSCGEATVAVNLSIAYLNPATSGTLYAQAEPVSEGRRMATYTVTVTDDADTVIATVQAQGYRTGTPLEELG